MDMDQDNFKDCSERIIMSDKERIIYLNKKLDHLKFTIERMDKIIHGLMHKDRELDRRVNILYFEIIGIKSKLFCYDDDFVDGRDDL
jgi:hypothetical protein